MNIFRNFLASLLLCFFSTSITAQTVTFTTQTLENSFQSGMVDMNGDFLDDIIIPSATALTIYYQNQNGSLTQSIKPINVTYAPDWPMAVADYDGNGINDVMYGGEEGVSFIRASADGSLFFEGYASTSAILSQRGNFIDIDNDGNLDAFMCNDNAPNINFINQGNGQFEEFSGIIGNTTGGGDYGSLFFDYDGDLDMDIYISKCFDTTDLTDPRRINQLFRNNGDGTYTDVAVQAGVDWAIQAWSTAVGDFDNDGDMDMIVADQHENEIGTKLMVNNGDGSFTDMTTGSGFETLDRVLDIVAFDFNNDGFLDFNGDFGSGMWLNNGDMTFTKIGDFGRSTVGDINNDGFLDIYGGTNLRVNDGNDNHYLVLNLEGNVSNRNGIGAIITIEGDFGIQTRNVRSGEGYLNAHTLNIHFGLGVSTEIETVTIYWPSGVVDIFEDVETNQHLLVEEGSTVLAVNENFTDSTIVLFPIPATSTLTINTEVQLTPTAHLVTPLGSVIKILIENNTIDIADLASGMYLLNAQSFDGENFSKTFIKE